MAVNQRWLNWRQIVLDDNSLSFGAKAMAMFLNTYMNDGQDMAYPSVATICGRLNISKPTATRYTNELQEAKYLVKQKRYGTSIIYYALIPNKILKTLDKSDNIHTELAQELDSSKDPLLVKNLYPSSKDPLPTVVKILNTNNQDNNQDNNQRERGTNKKHKFVAPTVKEISEYISAKGYSVDAHKFFEYYEAGEWHNAYGKKMKNWKQTVVSWNGRNNQPKNNKEEYEDWGI